MKNFLAMGVINLTPDSFSDGGECFHFETLKKRYHFFCQQKIGIVDFGAESTAPFNSPISATIELERYESILFPLVKELRPEVVISIDTYRQETFFRVYQYIKKHNPHLKLIWNDVSGVVDDNLISFLRDEVSDVDYVYSHTSTTEREKSSKHMENVIDVVANKCWERIADDFQQASDLWQKNGLASRVIFDPCFGFSKNIEQNISLIRDIAKLVDSFPQTQRFLLGISRKSFLKKQVEFVSHDCSLKQQTDYLQAIILSYWVDLIKLHPIIIRLHDPSLFSMLKVGMEIFKGQGDLL